MTELDLTKLREIAEAATDGPWNLHTLRTDETHDIRGSIDDEANIVIYAECEDADAHHIAAFDPPTVLALIGRIESAKSLHRQIPVHDECEHDADYGCSQFYLFGAYLACEESFIGWACQHCCYDDEIPIEYCPHEGNHRDVGKEDSCPTMRALIGGDSDD